MQIVIDVPDDEIFNGYYTQKDGIRKYHSMKSEYTVIQTKAECEDAVSRQAVLKEFEKGTENLYGRIDKLPSVQPKSIERPKKIQCKNCKYLIEKHANKRGHGGGRCACRESCGYTFKRNFSDTACRYFEEEEK